MEEIPAYDRDVLVRCLTRHYETLVRMGYMEDSNIQRPPPGGWGDQIDAKSLRIMGRNETVIDLLRHLPYLQKDYPIMPDTEPIQYLGMMWDDTLADKIAVNKSLSKFYPPLMPFDDEPEPGMICLTYGRGSTDWLIDTKKGYVYPCGTHWEVQRTQEDPPWLWYNPVAIEKYFNEMHHKFLSLDLIPLPGVIHQRKRGDQDMLEHEIFEDGEEQIRPVKRIFQDHGWPNFETFSKEECIKAANIARLQVVEKWTFRWAEDDIIKAEACGDMIEKEEAQLRLKKARIEYAREWE
ncbi:hypothetical protein VE01_00255 [Pseudogymnoascus verrucosus]|uniref:Uncharacterized protein n=1 Tax=Pseudogymnoascus verrucosus TaxID=342668 RepID=A0A2P2SWZ7_9PEZI|nr:uncharacterized protein VE01_00255 [Pseudogymnoascus verrucosus]OBU01350.1 hypothetical protein VE01_00255 [Pseudogymnoascus verrucosus]